MGDAERWSSQSGSGTGDQTEISALVRALSRAQGFALYFVDCNDPAYCRTVADSVRERLDRRVVGVDLGEVERDSTRPTIDFVLEQRLAEAPDEAAVFVWGLDHLLPSSARDETILRHTLNEVNWRREAWARLERPLVVWLPEEAIRLLARHAPDFSDWNSGVYVFDSPAGEG